MSKNSEKVIKAWPQDCAWPDIRYQQWGEYYAYEVTEKEERIDCFIADIAEAKLYLEELRENGLEPDEDNWPDGLAEDYWIDGQFDENSLEVDFEFAMSRLKLYGCEAAYNVERLIGYDFADEKLIEQAFIRRSFATEYGIDACNEELEFFGDAALNYVLTRTMAAQYGEITLDRDVALFKCDYNEGDMSRIRAKYVNKDYLSSRAVELGLDKFILYGTADTETDSAKEDMIEAIIGAVAIDSDWDYEALDGVIDKLLNAHIECPDRVLQKDYYEFLNSWHQKKWGQMPEYEIYKAKGGFFCTLRFLIPQNDKGLNRDQRIEVQQATRSKARSYAAEMACLFLEHYGLWMNLADSGIEPDKANSINQLQELYQKKYIDEPEYFFEDTGDAWKCVCKCDTTCGEGYGKNKTEAKKNAAYRAICHLFQSSGIDKPEWERSWVVLKSEDIEE